ncbi:MAG: DNA methyltransferase [Thermoanaerobaculia bacterium]|nr:MAG: DNA methyltransferase [Thermoanaerobaculia bacterium]
MSLSALELFCGLGGWRFALGDRGRVVAAWDVDAAARDTYEANHGERPSARELATVPAAELAAPDADTWLMSPPCQPFCRMGNRQGLADRRSRAFVRLMELFDAVPPDHLVLENVEGFRGSDAHELLRGKLRRHGMRVRELALCPTRLGVPNRRPRLFVVASRHRLAEAEPPVVEPGPLAEFLDPSPDDSLALEPANFARHLPGLDLVTPADRRSACFIAGYGQRLVGSGSFLRTAAGARRFSPGEVARLLGLPASFRFPPGLPRERQYRLLGNALSIPAARWAVSLLDG